MKLQLAVWTTPKRTKNHLHGNVYIHYYFMFKGRKISIIPAYHNTSYGLYGDKNYTSAFNNLMDEHVIGELYVISWRIHSLKQNRLKKRGAPCCKYKIQGKNLRKEKRFCLCKNSQYDLDEIENQIR